MMSMVDILLKENADLQAGYDAARLEIASLQARLATVSVGGVGSLVSVPPECPHLIWYADQDRKPEMFVGHGARDTAMKRFHMISQHWNANLFVRIKKSSRDCPYPVADLAPAPAQLEAVGTTAQPLHVAATSCPHEIDKDKIVLHFDSKQPGKNALAQLAARLQAAQAQPVTVPWENFPSYLIDHCEGDVISEEGLQFALSKMLSNPQYAPQPAAQTQTQEDVGGWRRAGALLYRLTGEHRPTNFDEIRVTMANGSRDIGQMSVQAERLLVMLTAPQPAAQAVSEPSREGQYAELPEHDATTVGLGCVWNRHSMRAFADATHALRASHGQAPAQAGEYQPSSADMVMAALDTQEWGLERMQHWHCLTDEGNREGAWLVKRQKAPYCAAYADKPDKPGETYGPRSWSGPTALDALQKAADDLGIRLPQPPACGAALAALKHPAVKPNMLVSGGALKLALNVLRRAGKNEVADELECTAQAAPVDAERWLDLLAEARAALWQPANAALCERLDAFIDAARAAQKGNHD